MRKIILLFLSLLILTGCNAQEIAPGEEITQEPIQIEVKETELIPEPSTIKRVSFMDFYEGKIEEPFMVYFSLEGCEPCKRYEETLVEIVTEHPEAPIYEIRVDQEEINIRDYIELDGVPMTIVKDGQEVFKKYGALRKEEVLENLGL